MVLRIVKKDPMKKIAPMVCIDIFDRFCQYHTMFYFQSIYNLLIHYIFSQSYTANATTKEQKPTTQMFTIPEMGFDFSLRKRHKRPKPSGAGILEIG